MAEVGQYGCQEGEVEMIRSYIEDRIGPLTDEEFNLSCSVVKNYIYGELGGSARVELVRELMLHTAIKVRSYRLQAWKEA
jgi:hypothetical protein